jgi:regulator of sigma E protease
MAMGFFITFLALGIVIFIHELGHLLAAKRSGIGVYEFSIGMGPKIYSFKSNETEYSLRILPFGGFVKLVGMDDKEDATIDPNQNFHEKPISKRFLTIAAGSIMNILLGFIIFIIIAFFVGTATPTNQIKTVFPNTPAAEAGLIANDKIVMINNNIIKDLIKTINKSPNIPLIFTIERDAKQFNITITPKPKKDQKTGIIGISFETETHKANIFTAISFGAKETIRQTKQVFITLSMLVKGSVNFKDMAGPIGIIQIASTLFNKGIVNFLNIMAIISISLGVINLMPFPVLDGGHIAFLGIEFLRKKKLNEKTETIINNTGAAILISLMVLIVINDILNWKERMLFLKNLTGI